MKEETQWPRKLPDDNHQVIVALETIHFGTPDFDTAPMTHETINYKYLTPQDDVAEKVSCASMVITVTCSINASTLGASPYLKCVITRTVGTDHIDLEECRRRGIRVINSPGTSLEAVSEHAVALYFATRRRLTIFHDKLYDHERGRPNGWKANGSLSSVARTSKGKAPPTCSQEVVGLIGYGAIGRRIEKLCQGLGMKVLVAGRKTGGVSCDGRVLFADVICQATVLVLALPLTSDSLNLISDTELAVMRPEVVIVNISRGGIVDETAVLRALQTGQIHGYGSDVFDKEPAGSAEESVLLAPEARGLNLVLTPHLAWLGDTTVLNIMRLTKLNVEGYLKGTGLNIVA